MYFRVTVLLIELPVPREVSGHVFACYRSFDWSACTRGNERSCIYVLQVFWLKYLYQGKWAVMYLRVTCLLIEVTVPREVTGHVFMCYRTFDWSACTKWAVMYLRVTGLLIEVPVRREVRVMYLRVTGLLIQVPVPREVSGHVFVCYRSFDWSSCTKGSERSCIYVLQVFWLKCLYQGKWTVMHLRNTGLLIDVTVPMVVSGHVFTCYRSFDSDWEKQGPWVVWYIQFCYSV